MSEFVLHVPEKKLGIKNPEDINRASGKFIAAVKMQNRLSFIRFIGETISPKLGKKSNKTKDLKFS